MSFDQALIESIASESNQLELIIGGDDDGSDCKHTGLNFEVLVDYVE